MRMFVRQGHEVMLICAPRFAATVSPAALGSQSISGYSIDSASSRIIFRLLGGEKLRFERQ